jgi:hypothetical protein
MSITSHVLLGLGVWGEEEEGRGEEMVLVEPARGEEAGGLKMMAQGWRVSGMCLLRQCSEGG